MKYIVSIDVESNGLYGLPFAVAAVVFDAATCEEVDRFVARSPIEGEEDEWIAENVLPEMESIPETHASLDSMLEDFSDFWCMWKFRGGEVLWHMGVPVEAYFFRFCVERGYLGILEGPFAPIELTTVFLMRGEEADSVEDYLVYNGIPFPNVSGVNNNSLLFYAAATAAAYFAE